MRMNAERHVKHLGWLALFASTSTLICCALPIALVMAGFGAAVAALTSSLPILVTLSTQKIWFFSASAALLGVSGWFIWWRGADCPSNVDWVERCDKSQSWNRRVFWTALAIWGLGFIAAYLALPVRIWLES